MNFGLSVRLQDIDSQSVDLRSEVVVREVEKLPVVLVIAVLYLAQKTWINWLHLGLIWITVYCVLQRRLT